MSTKNTLLLSAALSVLSTTPCYALDFDSLVNKLLVPSNSFAVSNQTEIKTLIANREAQIEQQIEAGARAGTLTSAEELELRNALNHAEMTEGRALADGSFSESEARAVVDELSRLNLKLNAYLTNATTTGYANVPSSDRHHPRGNAYGYWTHRDRRHGDDDAAPNQVQVQAMIDSKQAELDSAINRAVLNRTLSNRDAASLRADLNAVAKTELQAQANGRISVREQQDITNQLNSVDARFKASTRVAVNNRWGRDWRGDASLRNTTTYRTYLHQRIANAFASGKLNWMQANALYTKENAVAATERKAQSNGASYSYAEQKSVLAALDRLSAEIDTALGVSVQ